MVILHNSVNKNFKKFNKQPDMLLNISLVKYSVKCPSEFDTDL